jgi:two-component system nitrogen regulation response regulator GlnG
VIAATHQDLEQRVKAGAFREDLFHRLNVIRLRLPALRERRDDVAMLVRHFLQQSARQLGVEPKRISDAALARLSLFEFPGNVRQLENICHWLTVMAPAQLVEPKDLPPEVLDGQPHAGPVSAGQAEVVASATAASSESAGEEPAAPRLADNAGAVAAPAYPPASPDDAGTWELDLEREAQALLAAGRSDVWDVLTRRFESRLIVTALTNTRGRRIEAAQKLGIGRNTITRKIQDLKLD